MLLVATVSDLKVFSSANFCFPPSQLSLNVHIY